MGAWQAWEDRGMRLPVLVAAPLAAAVLTVVPAVAQQPQEVPDASITDGSAQRALDAAKARWKAKGPRSYTMRVRRSCFCPPPYTSPHTVVVRGGRITRAHEAVRDVATVPRLFRVVQRAIDGKAVRLTVRYDATRGVPRSIAVDQSFMIADEEQALTVDRFKRLR